MSNIFDALQRSESERPEVDSAAPSEATELLRRAERRASSDWKSATGYKANGAVEGASLDASIEPTFTSLAASVEDATSVNRQIALDSKRDIFTQFQSLKIALAAENRLVCLSDSECPAAEAIRLLGVRLRNLRLDRKLKKVLITSTVPQEGKSMLAANLACTLALTTQQRVLLMEGDLRRPSLSKKFGIGRNPGLSECLAGERALEKCIYYLKDASLWLLPAGLAQSNPLEVLQSSQLNEIADRLVELFDWIIIDSPPVLPLADTSVWVRLADGVILVTRQGTTERQHLLKGIEAIDPKKLIGALLNCSQSSSDYKDYYRAANAPLPNHESTS